MIKKEAKLKGFGLYFPVQGLCSDNAAMIAGLAYRLHKKGIESKLDITARLS